MHGYLEKPWSDFRSKVPKLLTEKITGYKM